jgi:hypothetical protein
MFSESLISERGKIESPAGMSTVTTISHLLCVVQIGTLLP